MAVFSITLLQKPNYSATNFSPIFFPNFYIRKFKLSCTSSLQPFGLSEPIADHYSATRASRREILIGGGFSISLLLLPIKIAEASTLADDSSLKDIREIIRNNFPIDKAPSILRLVFHDAGTFDLNSNSGGMNGSILYELSRPENKGLKRPTKVIELIKLKLEPKFNVSYADLIALCAAEAVALTGGPIIEVKLGRKDSLSEDPEDRMPSETLSAEGLKASFRSKGFSVRELVALSGSHTLGGKGFGEPLKFDNSYYTALLARPWENKEDMNAQMVGISSDRVMAYDQECLRYIEEYAGDQELFFRDFSSAFTKLVNIGTAL